MDIVLASAIMQMEKNEDSEEVGSQSSSKWNLFSATRQVVWLVCSLRSHYPDL